VPQRLLSTAMVTTSSVSARELRTRRRLAGVGKWSWWWDTRAREAPVMMSEEGMRERRPEQSPASAKR
jgi:hypothetical protein